LPGLRMCNFSKADSSRDEAALGMTNLGRVGMPR
jgi:hypothetical protein